jgi:hypothetical protein
MTIYDFVKNKTRKLGMLGTELGTRLGIRLGTRKNRNTKQSLHPSPKTQLVTQIQQSYRKKLKKQRDISNFPKKRATRKIMSAYRIASANPNLQVCNICLGAMLQPRLTKTLPCGHKFHRKCIDKWNANNPSCPLCRASIEPELPHHLRTRISMPNSSNINNTNIINTVNALIEGLPRAATMEEAINLLNESEVLIHNLPHNERTALREARNQVWLQTYPRLQQAPRQSRATIDAINSANALIDNMRSATTYDEARGYMDDSTIVINSLPRNGNAYRQLSNR